jgi:hypothetical protein
LLILNVSIWCALSPNAFQIRPTVDFDNPVSSVIARGARSRFIGRPVEATLHKTAMSHPTVCGHTSTSVATSSLVYLPGKPTRCDTAAPTAARTLLAAPTAATSSNLWRKTLGRGSLNVIITATAGRTTPRPGARLQLTKPTMRRA